MRNYLQGQTIRITGPFRNTSDSAVDPTTVKFAIRALNAAPTVYVYPTDAALVKDSVGNYHVDVELATAGRHIYRWEGDTPDAAFEKVIDVRRKRVETAA